MTKINQISTTTTRIPSTFGTKTKFATIVWYQQINKLRGFNYTQKKFLQHFLHCRLKNKNEFSVSAYDLQDDILQYYNALLLFINQNSLLASETIGRVNEQNHRMFCTPKGIRIQKAIRLALFYIQTERDIRAESTYWQKRFGDDAIIGNGSKEQWIFARYFTQKIHVFFTRLAVAINKSLSNIIHTCDPMSFIHSRRYNITFHDPTEQLNDLENIDDLKPKTITYCRIASFQKQAFSDFVIAYDAYIDKYVRYTNIIPDCQIQNRMISHSLLGDIQTYISSMTINAPKNIAKANQKDNSLNKQINLLYGYTTVINKIPVTSKSDRHFTINSRGEMSYTPAGKPTYLSQDKSKWLAGADRMITKYGKGVRKILAEYPEKIDDWMIEVICNKLKAKHTLVGDFVVVQGEDIRKWYHGENYNIDINTGSLAGSCMKYASCQPYMSIYAQNPDKCQMLIVKHMDKLLSRALLWTTDCGKKIMDRIYGSDKYINAVKTWANNNGYMTKHRQSYDDSTTWVTPTGEKITQNYFITLKYYPNQPLPYFDTFYMSDIASSACNTYGELKLSNARFENAGGLRSTSGSTTRTIQQYSNEFVGKHIKPANVSNAENSIPRPEPGDDEVELADGTIIHIDDSAYCEHNEEHYHVDECVWSEPDECHYHTSCAFQVDNNWYCEANDNPELIWCEYDDRYYHEDDVVGIYDGHGDFIEYRNIECSSIIQDEVSQDFIAYDDSVETLLGQIVHKDNTMRFTHGGDYFYIHETDDYEEIMTDLEQSGMELQTDQYTDIQEYLNV